MFARGEKPEYLLWVGCAGAFDDRYKKVVRALLNPYSSQVSYAVLERKNHVRVILQACRNEMLYQMAGLQILKIFPVL